LKHLANTAEAGEETPSARLRRFLKPRRQEEGLGERNANQVATADPAAFAARDRQPGSCRALLSLAGEAIGETERLRHEVVERHEVGVGGMMALPDHDSTSRFSTERHGSQAHPTESLAARVAKSFLNHTSRDMVMAIRSNPGETG
jgi:hypothetical protein